MRRYGTSGKILVKRNSLTRHSYRIAQHKRFHCSCHAKKIDALSKLAQSLPGIGWLADKKLSTLMSRAPVGEPQTSEQYDLPVTANAAWAKATWPALRPQRPRPAKAGTGRGARIGNADFCRGYSAASAEGGRQGRRSITSIGQ